MVIKPLPNLDVPVITANGNMTQPWYEFFAYIASLNLPAFSKAAPTNGQVPVWNDVSKLYAPGAN